MLNEKLRRIYELVGQLSTEVTDIELGWYLLFTCLVPQTPREVVDAIINVHKTGEGQRQTIMAVARSVFPDGSDELKFIGLLKERTDVLVGRRNAAIHCIIDIGHYVVPPRIVVAGVAKRSKLADLDVEEELQSCLRAAGPITAAITSFMDGLDSQGKASPALIRPRLKAGWKNPLSSIPAK